MTDDSEKYLKISLPQDFIDTGFITHEFTDGSHIKIIPEPSNDEGGYCVELYMVDSDGCTACDMTLDRFACMCLIQGLSTVLLNQDEINYLRIQENNKKFKEKIDGDRED